MTTEEKRKTALVLIADGCEAVETAVVVEFLRYAQIDVTLAGIKGDNFKNCTNAIKIVPDVDLRDVSRKTYDSFVLLGGRIAPFLVIKVGLFIFLIF